MKSTLVFLFSWSIIMLAIQCNTPKSIKSDSQPVSHQLWNELLQKHVKANGLVNYQGFKADEEKLNKYLQILSNNHPNTKNWSEQEQIAYWINAYNAYTIDLILQHYPLTSIKDITNLNIPFISSPWDIKFIEIEGQKYDLNNIEHGILRKQFNEPRIHVGVNCASISCPNLPTYAFTADELDKQLNKRMIAFLSDTTKNKITRDSIKVSKIFNWFKGDFTKNGQTLVEFLQPYTKITIKSDADIEYLDYNWNLNEYEP